TFPGFGTGQLGIGSPTFYHKASAEVGGATPDRNFSYYVGLGGYNQEFRYVDNTNGAGYSGIGAPLQELGDPNNCASAITGYSSCYANGTAGPGGFAMAGPNVPGLSSISDRDVIANVHFGLPHKHDGGKDDVQLLWDSGSLANYFYFSTNDQGGAAYLNNIGLGAPTYTDGYQWNGPVGVLLPANYQGNVSQYFFPQSRQHPFGSEIPANERDSTVNNQEIFKAQYQKNFGSSAYLRLYGYTYYSNWLQYGPQTTYSNYVGAASPDYELSSHTRGVSGTFADQINQQNLITLQASYTTANSIRDNNTQMYNGGGKRGRGIVLVNANDPLSGLCYDATGTAQSCDPAVNAAAFATWKQAYKGTIAAPPAAGVTCGGGPCAWLVAENSLYATYNTVVPKFTSYSLTDQWRPTDKLLFNVGVRLDGYQFDGSSTNANDPARAFWFRAFNMDKCVQASTGRLFDKSGNFGVSPTTACSSIPDPVTSQVGGFAAPNMVNSSAQVESYHEFQPRISGTYTFNPDNVVRFSYGKYAEPPNAAFEQYNSLQENLPAVLGAFVPFGFNTPGHTIVPATSQNADLSLEHHFKNTDWSFKLTPFLRKTKDQIQQFFLDQQSGFVSGLNVGRQTSEGVEFQLNKGDFSRNGLSGQLAFTYTHSQISYDRLANGNTVLAGINNDIDAFNKLTKAGGASQCYAPTLDPTTNALTGATAAACGTPGSYANPYYNAAPQGHISSDNVPTYDLLPGPIGASADAFGVPYFATFILNYKHDKFAITPTLQFAGGGRYGSPESNYGIDPTAGCTGLAGTNASNDPRYIYGGPNGTAGYDASSCLGVIPVPNTYTKQFDGLGAFVQPSQLVMNLQLSYDVSPKVQLIGTFANVVDSCFGGSKEAWTSTDRNYCAYGIVGAGAIPPVGNVYNPGAPIQQLVKYPYEAALGGVNVDGNSTKTPFNFFLEARIKL
ncbi:MAG: TonB-dependent receptor domain-containing protein, partial [Vulcanimicrobiaceae bacterium]